MKFEMVITWSKAMALLILGVAFILDIKSEGFTCFMFAVPFIVFLITGKQFIDKKKN